MNNTPAETTHHCNTHGTCRSCGRQDYLDLIRNTWLCESCQVGEGYPEGWDNLEDIDSGIYCSDRQDSDPELASGNLWNPCTS